MIHSLIESRLKSLDCFSRNGQTHIFCLPDGRLASPLREKEGKAVSLCANVYRLHLAKRNLLRGYLLDLPTGQSVAEQIVGKAHVLPPDAILANASPAERTVLLEANFHERTPLWYYILAEAAIQEQGQRLGVVGGTIVAETIIGLLAQSDDSILYEPKWEPTLPTLNADGKFDLRDIIRIAGVAPAEQ